MGLKVASVIVLYGCMKTFQIRAAKKGKNPRWGVGRTLIGLTTFLITLT